MPIVWSFLFGTGTRAALTSAGLFSGGYILGVKTSDAVAVAAGVGMLYYLNKRGA